jgi:hypothetical protein
MSRLLPAALALVLTSTLLALAAPAARADGDPASDYLIEQNVFLPYGVKIPAPDQQKLVTTIQEATREGFPIRVAVIWSDRDLGSVTALWRKPQRYARYLGAEITYFYKSRLLVVMPNGFGFNHPKHGTASETALLAKIPISPTPAGLVQAATTAVYRLAAANGVHIAAPRRSAAPAHHAWRTPIMIGAAAVAVYLVCALLFLSIRRHRRR